MLTLLCGQAVSAQKSARKFVFADEFKGASVSSRSNQTDNANRQKGWSQTQTATRTGLDQPKVSHLMRGRLSGFSADRFIRNPESPRSQR